MGNPERIFTPFGGKVIKEGLDDMGRTRMALNEEDFAKIERGHPWSATVTDQKTGKQYLVRGASCGSPHCFCAAEVVKDLSAPVAPAEFYTVTGIDGYSIHHACPEAGAVEVSEDWRFCPWCGRGIARAIKKLRAQKGEC